MFCQVTPLLAVLCIHEVQDAGQLLERSLRDVSGPSPCAPYLREVDYSGPLDLRLTVERRLASGCAEALVMPPPCERRGAPWAVYHGKHGTFLLRCLRRSR